MGAMSDAGKYLFRVMCSGGARSILLLPLVDRCLETIDVCISYSTCLFLYLL